MRRLLAGFAVGAVAFVAMAAPAFADDVTIRTVDTTAFPTVKVTAGVGKPDTPASSVTLQENGAPVKAPTVTPVAKSGLKVGVALVVDTSNAMTSGDRLKALKDSLHQYIANRQAGEQVAIIAAGNPTRVVTTFSSDVKQLNTAIDSLAPAGSLARWDGIVKAAALFTDAPSLEANIVVIAGGTDSSSTSSVSDASGAALAAKATVFAVGLGSPGAVDASSLQSVTAETGGQYLDAADSTGIPNVIARTGALIGNQVQITYVSTATGVIDLTVAAGAARATASVGPGTVASGVTLHPQIPAAPRTPSFLRTDTGKWLATGMVLLAAGLLAAGLLLLIVHDRTDLDAALRPYAESDDEDEEPAPGEMVLAETGFVRRAVATTAKLAQDRGVLETVEQRLEQADLPLRAAEALFFWAAAVVIVTAISLFLGGLIGAFAGLVITGLLPVAVLNGLASKRKQKFVAQLPDALQLLSGTLRSGYSLLQGVEAVSQEASDPIAGELRRVMIEARLGRPLEEALQDAADRMGSADFDWAVMAVRIQREVGGNLAELLDTVGETMVQRERLRRDIKSLTAEGRMSAWVLALLPPGVGFMMYTLNPGYVGTLFHDGFGKMMLVGATVLAIGGFLWMKKMIGIEA
jgi:tight adherence protein B